MQNRRLCRIRAALALSLAPLALRCRRSRFLLASLALRLRNLTPAESSVQLAARLGSKEGTRAFRQSLAFCFASNVPSLNKGREKMSKLLTDGHEVQAELKFDSTKMLRETNQDRKEGGEEAPSRFRRDWQLDPFDDDGFCSHNKGSFRSDCSLCRSAKPDKQARR